MLTLDADSQYLRRSEESDMVPDNMFPLSAMLSGTLSPFSFITTGWKPDFKEYILTTQSSKSFRGVI